MSVQQITAAQVSGGTGGGGNEEEFSATPGNVTSFSITAAGTVRNGTIAFANTTDSLYIAGSFTFGNLATGTARECYCYLYNNGGGTGRVLKVTRNSAGTGLTFQWTDESDRNLLTVTTGLLALGSLLSFNNIKYAAYVRSE